MSKSKTSRAKDIMEFSFLVAFANDGTLDDWEIGFMKKLALADGVMDDKEKRVFRQIFSRVSKDGVDPETWADIERFRAEYGI